MLEYLQTMTTYSGSTGFNPELAKQSLQNYNPILLYGQTDTMLTTIVSLSQKIHTKTNRVMVGLLTDTVLPKNRVHQIVIYIGLSTWDGEKVLQPSIFKANNGINCDVIFHTDTEDVNIVYYTQEQQMIYDIQKK